MLNIQMISHLTLYSFIYLFRNSMSEIKLISLFINNFFMSRKFGSVESSHKPSCQIRSPTPPSACCIHLHQVSTPSFDHSQCPKGIKIQDLHRMRPINLSYLGPQLYETCRFHEPAEFNYEELTATGCSPWQEKLLDKGYPCNENIYVVALVWVCPCCDRA